MGGLHNVYNAYGVHVLQALLYVHCKYIFFFFYFMCLNLMQEINIQERLHSQLCHIKNVTHVRYVYNVYSIIPRRLTYYLSRSILQQTYMPMRKRKPDYTETVSSRRRHTYVIPFHESLYSC